MPKWYAALLKPTTDDLVAVSHAKKRPKEALCQATGQTSVTIVTCIAGFSWEADRFDPWKVKLHQYLEEVSGEMAWVDLGCIWNSEHCKQRQFSTQGGRFHHWNFALWQVKAVATCLWALGHHAAGTLETKRDTLQCHHQCLREGRAMATGLGIIWGDADFQSPSRHHQLQCKHQCLRESWWVAESIEIVCEDAGGRSKPGCLQLQRDCQCLWEGWSVAAGTELVWGHVCWQSLSKCC